MKSQAKIMALLMFLTSFAIIACTPGNGPTPPHTYTVAFDSQDATVAADPTSKMVVSGTTVDALPTEPTKNGYIFDGWYTAIDGGGTEFNASTTVTADITVYAKWTEKLIYAIGDTGPGGGTVFFTTSDGMGGLEAAPALWNGGSEDPLSAWSNVTSTAVGTTGTAIGTGLANSNAIIAQSGHTASAAKLCRDYTGGGKTDWFLPSKDELTQMYAQKAVIGGLSTTGDGYWSSSEANTSYALLLYNYDGLNYNVPKNFQEWVRPVRAFGTPLTTEFINDGFEGGAIGGDWLNATTSGSIYWTIIISGSHPVISPHSGSAMAGFLSWNYASASARIYRSSGFAIPSSSIVTLTFFMYHDIQYSNADQLQVQVSTDGGSSWNNVGSVINRYDATTGWTKYTIDLTAYHGQTVLLGFLGISAYGNDIYIDDVLVIGTN